jgi:hypothetical protein
MAQIYPMVGLYIYRIMGYFRYNPVFLKNLSSILKSQTIQFALKFTQTVSYVLLKSNSKNREQRTMQMKNNSVF